MKRCQEPGTDFKNMKKLFFSIAALALAASSNAQQVTAPEPEFIGSYCMLTSDSTYVVLPKENGKVEKHQNKFSKFSKIAGAVSDLGFAGGMVGLSTGSMAGLETGVRVMGTAACCGACCRCSEHFGWSGRNGYCFCWRQVCSFYQKGRKGYPITYQG